MEKGIEKKVCSGEQYKIAIVKSRFNEDVISGLLQGALKALKECGVKEENIKVLEVPGSFELPFGAKQIADKKEYDAIVCLGAIIKGETNHDHHIAGACAKGLIDLSLEYNIPILFGVITALNIDQAAARSADNDLNRGYEAALSAVEILENIK